METDWKAALFPRIAAHLAELITPLDEIGQPHQAAGRQLAEWLSAHHRCEERLTVVVVCTGNSRRSVLGAMMGNAAASFLGIPELRFFSAGTTPSAFNPRTVQALRAIGFEVEPTGEEAARGPDGLANPRYLVRWGTGPDQQMLEFSKALGDRALPGEGFAALMVCDEADAGCPIVSGAVARISMPFADPKSADGMPEEAEHYAATRDEIGRIVLAALAPLGVVPGA
jgi:arsenate reductase